VIVLLAAIALAIAERGKRDPVRWGAPGTAVSLASGLALLATTIAAACSGRTELVGLVPIAIGIALRVLAMRALGDAFTSETVFVPGRPILTSGLHRWTRHPSDLGLVLYAGGIAALGASRVAFGFAFVVLATVVVRIIEEEKVRSRSGGG
jgi:protein-S-isoprenylcysteine O-methyltransferase Ste14